MKVLAKVATRGDRERPTRLDRKRTRALVEELFGTDLHSKRVESVANAVTGTLRAARLSVHAIGLAYSGLAEISPKHGIKQVNRYLGNGAISIGKLLPNWAKFVIGARKEILLAVDWTEFDDDDHTTLAAYVLTGHGRATPLYWQTVKKSTLKGKQKEYEDAFVKRIHDAISPDVAITMVADRGFGSQQLYGDLAFYGWDYIIRFRGNILVEVGGVARPASEWVTPTGRAKRLDSPRVTADRAAVPAVVVVHDKRMKEVWCLATSHADKPASFITKLYGKRFTIEETFRDQKDLRFGLGLRATHIRDADRRDRLLLLAAVAHALLTLLGAASEEVGMDRLMKASTTKRRVHSLFRQGSYWYSTIPTMPEQWLVPLMESFDRIVQEHRWTDELLGVL